MMRIVSLRATSNFLVCLLRHQAGTAYSDALYATAKALMRSVDVLAPHEVPAKHLIRLFLAELWNVGLPSVADKSVAGQV